MERILFFASILIGLLTWGIAAFSPRRDRPADAPPPEKAETEPSLWRTPLGITATALPFIGFLLTLPTTGKFFSPGQDLGRGFLIGGIAAMLAAFPVLRGRGRTLIDTSFGLAAVAAAVSLLFLRAGIIDALAGVAIGWFATTFPLLLAIRRNDETTDRATSLMAGAGFAAALCGAAALGIWRDEVTPALAKTTWSALIVAFSALSGLVCLVFRMTTPASASPAIPAVIYAVLAAGAMKLLTVKVAPEPRLFWATAAGLVVWPVAAWLMRDAEARNAARNPRSPVGLPALAALLVAGGFVASYQMLHGIGAGAFVLALWLSAAAMPRREGSNTRFDIALLLFATVLMLDRVFATRYTDEMKGVVLTDQYGLFGLMVGALMPGLAASLIGRRVRAGVGGVLTLVLAGTLALGVPAIIILLFGGKSALALLLGFGLGSAQNFRATSGDSSDEDTTPGVSLLPGAFSLGSVLALAQFTGPLLPLTEMTRMHKVQLLGVLIMGIVIALVAAEAATRGARRDAGAK